MKRKHAFVLIVLLAGAFVAGLFALTRTSDLSASTNTAADVSEAAIRARMNALDRFEASLQRQLREKGPKLPRVRASHVRSSASAPVAAGTAGVTYVHASAPASRASFDDEDDEYGHGDDDGDEGHELEHEDD
jgi:hypothetical protein